jgi:hypothetical protein
MKYAFLLVCMLALGCSPDTEEEDNSVLYDSAKVPLDKAESVEDTVLEGAKKLEDAIEESGD